MGTSTARKAPTGKFWRRAKASASRFSSSKNNGQVSAAEVVAGYVTAIKDNQAAAPIFPQIQQVAGNLGRFYQKLALHGLDQAWRDFGLDELIGTPMPSTLPALVDILAGPGAALEAAVARSALIEILAAGPVSTKDGYFEQRAAKPGEPSPQTISGRIRNFLAEAVYQKLASDLGEALEAQAADSWTGAARLQELRQSIQGILPPPDEEIEEFDLSWSDLQSRAWIEAQLQLLLDRLEQGHAF
ncbi:MAG: hypothetical protein ACLFUU_07345 [Desulfobacteraceae bacterium]